MYKSSFQSSRIVERRYKQMLEEEQKSLARNKKLLEDIDRLEEQIKFFSNECKQDEERLKKAKNKFMKYVKSVYPKWAEDVKKWQEMKKEPHRNLEQHRSDLHSTPYRNFHSFTDFKRLPYHSVPDNSSYYPGSSDYRRDKVENSGENLSYDREDMDYSMDRNRSYRNSSKKVMGHPMRSSRDTKGYSNDRVGIFRDRDSYPRNMFEFPSRERMAYPRDIPRSFRETTDLSWDEMGFSRGYSRSDIGYPRMYNGGPWMYPQHTPPGMYPHSAHPYFVPMPAPFGVPPWSTPGYDHWSDPRGRSFEDYGKGERQGFPGNGKERAQNESFVGDGREQREGMRDEVSPSARNGDLFHDEGKERHANQRRNSRDGEDFTGRSSPENVFDGERVGGEHINDTPAGVMRQNPGRDHSLRQQKKENYQSNTGSRASPQKTLEGKTDKSSCPSSKAQDRGDFEMKQVRGEEMNDRIAMDVSDQRYLQPKEELTDRTTISEHFDAVKVSKPSGGEYLGEPIRDIRLIQMRTEGSGFGSRDVVNTDSISLPTIHQYEGDPRDIFSDISDTENLNQNADGGGKQGELEDYNGYLGSEAPKQYNAKAGGGISGIQQRNQDDDSPVNSRHSREKDTSNISNSQTLGQNDASQIDRKENVKDPQEFDPKVLHKGKKVESSVPGSQQGLLQREVLGSKSSVVEDLIGDDVSDFEVSEAELSDEDMAGKKPLSENLISGSVKRETEGVTGEDETEDDNVGMSNGNMVGCEEIGQNDIFNESLAGFQSEQKNSSGQRRAARKSVPPIEKDLSEISETGHTKEDVLKRSNSDEKVSDIECGVSDASLEQISEEIAKTSSENSKRIIDLEDTENNVKTENGNIQRPKIDSIQDVEDKGGMKVDTSKGEGSPNEHQEVTSTKNLTDITQEGYREKLGESIDKESDEKILSEDEKSKSGILEEISFSSEESTFESVPAQEKNQSKKSESKTKDSVSYSEDFEDEKSIPLTQSAAYQKMLNTVDVSDEDEDLERDFLEGTMSEANTTAQSAYNMPQTLQDSAATSKSKPTLSLFSSGEDDFRNDGVGGLSPSWKSSEGSLSPPLSPATGGYVPSLPGAGKVENKQEQRKEEKKKMPPLDESKDGKVETGKKLQESDTKSRIQAGFWNHSDSESEVDLQISHGGNDNNDDGDDFDFYS